MILRLGYDFYWITLLVFYDSGIILGLWLNYTMD